MLVLVLNLVMLAILGVAGIILQWSGPGFTLGCSFGFMLFFVYFRFKHGYWP